MPIYEYQCTECGHRLEKLQKMSDPPLTTCPNCRQEGLVKQVSRAGFRLKGTGWYETDFKQSGQKNLDKADTAQANDAPAAPAKTDKASNSDTN